MLVCWSYNTEQGDYFVSQQCLLLHIQVLLHIDIINYTIDYVYDYRGSATGSTAGDGYITYSIKYYCNWYCWCYIRLYNNALTYSVTYTIIDLAANSVSYAEQLVLNII